MAFISNKKIAEMPWLQGAADGQPNEQQEMQENIGPELNPSEMMEEIKLQKFDQQPWGFRLTGGTDFGTPITVIKVNGGSSAEQAGLRVGDMLKNRCSTFGRIYTQSSTRIHHGIRK